MEKPKSPCPIVCPRRRPDCHRADICKEWGEYEAAYHQWIKDTQKEREKAMSTASYKKDVFVKKLKDKQRKDRYRRR